MKKINSLIEKLGLEGILKLDSDEEIEIFRIALKNALNRKFKDTKNNYERNINVVLDYYSIEKISYKSLGLKYGISEERIRQINEKCIRSLKYHSGRKYLLEALGILK